MKAFKFKLAPVLRVRRHEEEQQRMKFAKVRQRQQDLQDELENVHQEIERHNRGSAEEMERSSGEQRMQHRKLNVHFNYLQDLHQRVYDLKKQLQEIKKEVEKERKALVSANKRVKVLENLESQQRMQFLERVDKLEEKQLNEIATQRYNWQRR
ncbi:MAG: flagellar export protein FliJ [Bacteroidota bacterium]